MNSLSSPVANFAFLTNFEKCKSKLSVDLNLANDKKFQATFFWSDGTNNFLVSCLTWNHDRNIAASALDLKRSLVSPKRHEKN